MTDTAATPATLAALFKVAMTALAFLAFPAFSADLPASNTTTLTAALKVAACADRILAAPGVYPALRLTSTRVCADPVVITSADPASPAVFKGGMQLTGLGLRFEAVTFDVSETPADFGAAVTMNGGADVTLHRVAFKGRETTAGAFWGYGFVAKGVQRLTITESTFTTLARGGVVAAPSTDFTFTDNDLERLGSDGLTLGGLVGGRIERNSFVDFRPQPTDHPDAIQGMQLGALVTGGPVVNRNITIGGNLVWSKAPGRGPQCVFFMAENGARGGPFTVSDNLCINTGYRGISFSTMDFVNVTGNRLLFQPDPTGVAGYSSIIFQDSTGTATNNQAVRITLGAVADGGGNVIIPQSTAAEVEAAAAAWRAKHRAPAFDPMARIAELEAILSETATALRALADTLEEK